MTLTFFVTSCAPSIHYLGDSHQSNNGEIDVFYAESEVDREYKIIGRLANGKCFRFGTERLKEAIIKKGKEEGGDAIIFTTNKFLSDQ